ncbi:MAG: O-antigen ligase family protein [Phycisphaerae bacterium]|nr:O-antigen ligase family protein [Phycisphaerae bacterium]
MAYIGIVVAMILFLMALVGPKPYHGLLALVLSCYCSFPIVVAATGTNSAVWVIDVVLIAVLLRWGVTVLRRTSAYGQPPGASLLVMLVCMAVISLGVYLARYVSVMAMYHFGFYSLRFLAFVLAYYIAALLPISRDEFRRLVTWIVVLTVGMAIANIISRQGMINMHFYMANILQTGYIEEQARARDMHGWLLGFNRASVGLFAFLTLFLLLMRSWLGKMGGKVFLYLGLPLIVSMLLDSFSRAALLGAFTAFVVAIIRLKPKNTLSLVLAVGVGGLAITFMQADVQAWTERFAALFSEQAFRQSTGQGRIEAWMRLLAYLIGNPQYLLTGSGFYCYSYTYTQQAAAYSAAHNMYLQALSELGIVGLTLMLIFWTKLTVLFFRLARKGREDHYQHIACNVMLAIMLGALASGLSQETLFPAAQGFHTASLFMILFGATISTFCYAPAEQASYARFDVLDSIQRQQLMRCGYA